MLADFFESPFPIHALSDSPDGRLLEGFAQDMCRAGYAAITARRHIRAAEHFIYWIGRKRTPIVSLDERYVDNFVHHLDRCHCPQYGRTHKRELQNSVRLFFNYLRRADVLIAPVFEESIEDPTLLISFRRWMRQLRGACDVTLDNYNLPLRDLLKKLGEDPSAFDAQKLRHFVLQTSQRCGWASAKRCTAVRMFLRFLISTGKCAAGLEAAIPQLAHWRLSSFDASDWVILASVRDTANWYFDYAAEDQDARAITMPADKVKWFKDGGYTDVVDETNVLLTKDLGSAFRANSFFKKGYHVTLFINSDMLSPSTIIDDEQCLDHAGSLGGHDEANGDEGDGSPWVSG